MSICEKDIIKKPYNEALVLENLRRDYGLTIINNVNSNLIVCSEIFNGPLYTTNLTKLVTGLTENSIGVFNLNDSNEGNINIQYTFTGNQETLTAYTGNFISKVYKRRDINETDLITINPNQLVVEPTTFSFDVIKSDVTEFSTITTSGYSYTINTNFNSEDQEYILNSYTEFFKNTCVTTPVIDINNIPIGGYTNIVSKITNPSLENIYSEDSSWYFVTLVNPETPQLGPFPEPEPLSPEILTVIRKERPLGDETYVFGVPQQTEINNKCRLITENLTINPPSSTIFSISTIPEPNSMLISVNGITLSTDDYSISGQTTIILTQPLDPNKDIITATYIDCDQDINTIYAEQYEIVSGVTSGATSGYTSEKVYYNTDQSKYEYYLDFEPDEVENIMLFLNGIKLTYGLDYVLSTSVDNRIIFIGVVLGVSDIIFASYFSGESIEGDYGLIETQNGTLEWSVENPIIITDRVNGEFIVEVTESTDTTFSSTATTKQVIVEYFEVEGDTLFSTAIPSGLNENQKYIWRVINKKVYSGLLGNIFTTESISRVGKFYTKILPY